MSASVFTSDATTPAGNAVLHTGPGMDGANVSRRSTLFAPGDLPWRNRPPQAILLMVHDNRRNNPPSTDETCRGQLPYLTHGLATISSLPGIVTYISRLPGSSKLDGHASTKEKARRTAWRAHAASTLGGFVVSVNLLHSGHNLISTQVYSFHSSANYWKPIRSTLVKMMPVPQRYYVR